MSLQGLRLALLEETPEEGNLDTHQLKTVIGTPYITARKMRQDDVTFETTHTLFVNTNHYPLVATTDHGTWRRLTALRFPFRFVDPVDGHRLAAGERWGDTDLKARIQRDPELPAAALAWIVEGARRWVVDKAAIHVLPPSVRDATDEWRADSDVGYQFAGEHLELSPHALVPVDYMLTRFNEYLEQHGKKPWSNRVVAGRLPGSIRAALGVEVAPAVVKVQERHYSGISEPFGLAKHVMPAAGKTMRAWSGVRFRAPESAYTSAVDGSLTEGGHQLELEAEG
jgi:putative DNA primase/helicase